MQVTRTLVTDQLISTFRTALIALGTALVSLDLLPQTEVDKWAGIVMAIASFAWIVYSNFKTQDDKTDATVAGIQTGQAMPQKVESEAVITAKLNKGEIVVPAKPIETPTTVKKP